MVNKEVFHTLHWVQVYAPLTCANTAAVEAAFGALGLDTTDAEVNTFVLVLGTAANSDFVITLMESATAAGAGTAVAAADCKVVREDGDVAKIVGPTLTTTAGADTAHTYFFQYKGRSDFIRLTSTVGTQATIVGCYLLKTHLRNEPAHA
jgi:NADPH-dependent curcumin reductase CurA